MANQAVFQNDFVQQKFDEYPADVRQNLLIIRELIFEVAQHNAQIGPIEETLKWNEPSYLPKKPKVGSTIRMNWKPKTPDNYYLYFNCKTTLIDTFKEIYGDTFAYGGNRSLIFQRNATLPLSAIKDCLAIALTYHLNK